MASRIGRIVNLGGIARALTTAANAAQAALYQTPPTTIEGVEPKNWPTALQPVQPIGPAGSEPLGLRVLQGMNLTYTPRSDAQYSAADLKTLAQYPLARICIENVKDSICKIPWQIHLVADANEKRSDYEKRNANDKLIPRLTEQFKYPDGEHGWRDWVRPLLDDMLVIDAASILLRRDKKDNIAEMRVIPGESITRYVTDLGYTPTPPSPAYAQLWEGIPRVNLTTRQLVYAVRNIVRRNTLASQLYGYGPTEQVADEITAGVYRLRSVLAFYTDGSVPNMVQVVPRGVPASDIKEAMLAINSELAGNLARRRQIRLMQGFQEDGKPDQFLFPSEPALADSFDELHIRKICFAYGTSPQRLMKIMNRASAEQSQESAEEEGTLCWLDWLQGVMNYIIQRQMGFGNYELTFQRDQDNDVVKQATVDKIYTGSAQETINERRKKRGEEPRPEPEADMLGVMTPQGFVPIDARPPAPMPFGMPSADTNDAGGNEPSKPPTPKKEGEKPTTEKLAKAGHGVMLAWYPPAAAAAKIAQEGGEKAEELHVTLLYLGKAEKLSEADIANLKISLQSLSAQLSPLQGNIGGVGRFPATASSDDKDVLIQLVDFPRLEALRERLIAACRNANIEPVLNHGYTPHMTVAYVDSESTAGVEHPLSIPATLDAITLAVAGEHTIFPLTGTEVIKVDACEHAMALLKAADATDVSGRAVYLHKVSPDSERHRQSVEDKLRHFFAQTAQALADKIRAAAKSDVGVLSKFDDDQPRDEQGRFTALDATVSQALEDKGFAETSRGPMASVYSHDTLGSVHVQGGEWIHYGAVSGMDVKSKSGADVESFNRYVARGGIEHTATPDKPKDRQPETATETNLRENPQWKRMLNSDSDTVTLYHVTHSQNEESIKEKGLNTKEVALLSTRPNQRTIQEWTVLWMGTEQGRNASVVTIQAPKHAFREMLEHPETSGTSGELVYGHRVPKSWIKSIKPLKADIGDLAKAQSADEYLRLVNSIKWDPLVDTLAVDLEAVAANGGRTALAGLNLHGRDMIQTVNTVARDWARTHAAELVGMRWQDGKLIPNPDSRWNIAETTRESLRRLVTEAFETQSDVAAIADQVQNAGILADWRARMIARTEVSRSEVMGNVFGWQESGMVEGVDWNLSADHDDNIPCECPDLAEGSPYPLDAIEILDFPPHPNCFCSLSPSLITEPEKVLGDNLRKSALSLLQKAQE